MSELHLRRKLTVRAHGRTLVLVKHPVEKLEHRLMMALTWALYLPHYPDLRVDVPVSSRYRPDLVQLDAGGRPVFWGECGEVGQEKLRHLCSRHHDAHLVFTKWAVNLEPVAGLIDAVLAGVRRTAPVELLGFGADSERFFEPDGSITIAPEDVERRLWPA
jgi:hypothetical protein